MRAVILAAGRGSRLKHITVDKPKCLTVIDGKPLLEWQIDALSTAGIKKIAIVRGYLKEKIAIDDIAYFDNLHWQTTQMVSSLLCAEEWLSEEECIISYSDIIYRSGLINKLMAVEGDIVIPYNSAWQEVWQARFGNPLIDSETFKIDKDGFLIEIGKRPNSLAEIQGQYMGIIKLTPCGWQRIKKFLSRYSKEEIEKMDFTNMLNQLLECKMQISTIPINGGWFEFDSENDLYAYEKLGISKGGV